jgi:putative peptidoglycan lipid II flippase
MTFETSTNGKVSTPRFECDVPVSPGGKIFRAAAIVSVFSAVAGLGATARELVVARWFGRSDALDAFLIAYLLPSFVINLVSGSFSSALIPTFIQVRQTEGRDAAQRLFSGIMVWSLGLLVAVSILVGLFAPYYLPLLGSGFSSAKLMLTVHLLYVLLPFVVLSGLAATWTAVLNAGERFALPALLPILPPICAIAFLVLTGKRWGIFALAIGTVVGVGFQSAILAVKLKAQGLAVAPRWSGLDPHLRQVAGQYVPMLAGTLLMGTTDLVDQSMAAMLEPGSVSALNYARKVVSVFIVLGAVPLSTAALPYFSQMVAKRDWAGCRRTLSTYSKSILAVTVPATLGLVFFSRPLIRILFQRGAFTAQDTSVVSGVLIFLSLQIPFFMLCSLAVRVISALKRNSVLMLIATVNTILNVVFNLIFMRYAGVAGIALSTSVVYLIACFMIYGWIIALMTKLQAGE